MPLVDGAASVEEALAGAVHKLREAVAEDAGPHARGRPEANGGILGRLLIVLGNVGPIACRMGGAKVVVLEARDLQRAGEVCGLSRRAAETRRTSADIVSGFWALPIQSRQSAVLKAHCWHAQAQLTSAWLCRWHPPEERMCAAAHAWQPDARDAHRPINSRQIDSRLDE